MISALDYIPNAILSNNILQKFTGTITLFVLDAGQFFEEKISPLDTFIHIIDGRAIITIKDESKFT